jgi:hypothetical protein
LKIPKKFRVSRHAEEEMRRRRIPQAWFESVLEKPEQRIEQPPAVEVRQSRFAAEDGKIYLLRVVIGADKEPPVVITVYRTSKIEKYWRPE